MRKIILFAPVATIVAKNVLILRIIVPVVKIVISELWLIMNVYVILDIMITVLLLAVLVTFPVYHATVLLTITVCIVIHPEIIDL